MVGELSVVNAEHVECFEVDLTAGGGDPEKFAVVGAVVGLVGRDPVGVDGLPVDVGAKVGKAARRAV
jgi:hypothetical protein